MCYKSSIIYFWQFIHLLSLRSCGNGTSFTFTSYIIESTKFCNIKFLNLLFHFILLPFVQMQHITIKLTLYLEKRKAKNDTHIHAHKKNIQIKKKTLWSLFMDGVQLPQGYSSTLRRQFTFYH